MLAFRLAPLVLAAACAAARAAAPPAPAPVQAPSIDPSTLQSALAIQDAFASVAERVTPSVVAITVYAKGRPPTAPPPGGAGWQEGSQPPDRYPGYGVAGAGSGFLVSDDGYILTCHHVLLDPATKAPAEIIDIELAGDRHTRARVIGFEPNVDLAVLKLEVPQKLVPVVLGDSDRVQVGHWALALGDPSGTDRTFVAGVIANRPTRECYQGSAAPTLLQTSIRIHPESYGGPLTDIRGAVIGMCTPGGPSAAPAGDPSLVPAYALPINLVRTLYEALREKKSRESPWLGFSVLDLGWELRQRLEKTPRTGVYIDDVYEPSPASRAGIRVGDVLVRMDGNRLLTVSDFQHWLYLLGIGKPVRLALVREGRELEVETTIEQRPAAAALR